MNPLTRQSAQQYSVDRAGPGVPLTRGEGTTLAEQYLRRLCDRTFLSLWSHAGIYRDQGPIGKEVCDLLVVFENHILIFSDKYCEVSRTGKLALD